MALHGTLSYIDHMNVAASLQKLIGPVNENGAYKIGHRLWFAFTVIKLLLTSYILLDQRIPGHTAILLGICFFEAVALIYLVYDFKFRNKGLFILTLLMINMKDLGVELYFYHHGRFNITLAHLFGLSLMYMIFNQTVVRSRIIGYANYLFLTVISIVLASGNPVSLAWFIMMGCGIIAVDILLFNRFARQANFARIERHYGMLRSKYRLADAQIRSVRHDIRNALVPLQIIVAEKRNRGCNGETCERMAKQVNETVTALLNEFGVWENEKIDVRRTVERILREARIPGDAADVDGIEVDTVELNAKIFNSITFNLLSNAREAYLRHHGSVDGLRVRIALRGLTLVIEDNAGGFNVDAIDAGMTEKENARDGNGMFLYQLTHESDKFDVDVDITRINAGTRVMVTFLHHEPDDVPGI